MTTTTLPPLAFGTWMRHDIVMAHIDDIAPTSIVELGIGKGAMSARMSSKVDRFVGVEPDPESREIAAAVVESGEVIGSLDELDDESFDLLCAFEVLEHIEDDRTALMEWLRVVQPGGYVMVSVPAFQSRFGPFDDAVGHYRRYDPEHLQALLTDCGLRLESMSVNGAPMGFASEFVKNRMARRWNDDAERSKEDRSLASGRVVQPSGQGKLIEYGSLPFRHIQKLFPNSGTGLLALAQKAE